MEVFFICFGFVEGQVGKVSREQEQAGSQIRCQQVEVKREAVLRNYSPSASQPQARIIVAPQGRKKPHEENRQQETAGEGILGINWI